jgi:hypothetical protein
MLPSRYALLALAIVLAFSLSSSIVPTQAAADSWWNTGWSQRKEVSMTENSGYDRINEPLEFNVSFNPGEVSDCNQLRVTELRPLYNVTNFLRTFVGKILYNNFEPDEGTWKKDGSAVISTDRYKSSSHSIYLPRGNKAPSSRVYTNVTIPADKGDIIVFGWFQPTTLGTARPMVFTTTDSASSWRGPYTYFTSSKYINAHDEENDRTTDTQFNYQTDTWIAVRYVIHPETKSYDIYYDTTDGTQLRERDFPRPRFYGYYPFINTTVTFELMMWNENDMDMYVDDLFIAPASIWVNGLKTDQKVELYGGDGILKSACSASNAQNCTLDAWKLIFPFSGYFKVYNTDGTLAYTSQNYTDIWGGDIYSVTQSLLQNKETEVPFVANDVVYCNSTDCSDQWTWKTLSASDLQPGWRQKTYFTSCKSNGNPDDWMFLEYDDSSWSPVNLSDSNWGCSGSNCDRYYRKVFYIDGDIEKADITFRSDDGMAIWINGMYMGHNWNGCFAAWGPNNWNLDVKSKLHQGWNIIDGYVTHQGGGNELFDITSANITYKVRKNPASASCIKADLSVYTNLSANANTKFYVYYNSTNRTSAAITKSYEYQGLWNYVYYSGVPRVTAQDLIISNPHDHQVNLTFVCWNRDSLKFGTLSSIISPFETVRLNQWLGNVYALSTDSSNYRCYVSSPDYYPVQWKISSTDKLAITQDEWGHSSKTYVPTADKTSGREFQGSSHNYGTYSFVTIANPTNETANVIFQCWRYDRGNRGTWKMVLNQKYSYRTDQWGPSTTDLYNYGSCGNGNPYRWRVTSDKDIIVYYEEYDGREAGDLAYNSKNYMGREFIGVGTNITGNDFLRIINPGPAVSAKLECWDKDGILRGPWYGEIKDGYLNNTYWWNTPSNFYTSCGSNPAYLWRLTTNDTVYTSFHSYNGNMAFTSNVLPSDKMPGKNFWVPGRIISNSRLVFGNPYDSQTNVTVSCLAKNGTMMGSWNFMLGSKISKSTVDAVGQDLTTKCSADGNYMINVNSSQPIILSYWEWDGTSGDFDYIPQTIGLPILPNVAGERTIISGPAELLTNGSIKMNQYGRDWFIPANWTWEWNQTDSVQAGEPYFKQKKINYNASYNFIAGGSPYFNITGWVLDENSTCAKFTSNFTVSNCTANMSQIMNLGSNWIYLDQNTINRSSDVLWDDRMPLVVPLPVKELVHRQDSSQTTTVNGNAYSLIQINVTNNASGESQPANFTNVIIRKCSTGFNCTGFTRVVDTMENVWIGKSQDATGETLSSLRREGSNAMNLTWDPVWDPTNQDAYFNGAAAAENLTDFSSGKMGFWLYSSNISSFTLLEFELGDNPNWGQSNWLRFRNNTPIPNGWKYLQFDMNSYTASSGTTISWASVYPKVRVAGTGNSGPQSWILIDDWRMWVTPSNYTLARLNVNQTKTEYRLLTKSNAIIGISGASNDWTQDVSQITTAGTTTYVKGNININNTDSIVYENVSLPANQPEQSRSNWTCSHPAREIYSISSIYNSTDNLITCNKTGVITKNEGSWAQVGTATISSQTVKKSVALSNTDPMVTFNNIAWSTLQESACGWTTSTLSGTVNLAANGSTVAEANHSGDCIINTLSNWKQYIILESNKYVQYIAQNLTIINSANTNLNIKLYGTDFSPPTSLPFTADLDYSDPTSYDNPIIVSAGQTVIKSKVGHASFLSQSDGAKNEQPTYFDRLVTITCADACDKLSSVKLTITVNDTNYTSFKIYRKNGSNWDDKTSAYGLSVSSGTATWYTTDFGSSEEYKLWGNYSGNQPAPPPPPPVNPPSITIISPNSPTYANEWIWANVSLNDSANWCGVSLNGTANQSMSSASATYWYLNLSAANGPHSVRFWCNGTNGAMGVSDERLFTVDTSAPAVTMLSPTAMTYNRNVGLQLTFIVSVQPNATWHSVDGGIFVYAGNTTFDVSGDGPHNITVYANDSLGKTGSSTANFNTDITAPSITIQSPLQQNYSTGVWFNASLNEAGSWCGYSLDSASNYTMSGSGMHFAVQNNTVLTIGQHSFTIFCNDTASNMGSASSVFNFSATVPNPPNVTLILPLNATYNYRNGIALNYAYTGSPTSCSYYLDGSGPTTLAGCTNTTFNVAADGPHSIIVIVSNAGGSDSKTVSFTVDTVTPTVYIYAPANGTYTSTPISLTYTSSEPGNCTYSLSAGSNSSLSGNTTISPSNGDYNITVYCTDAASNTGKSNSSYFNVNVQQQQQQQSSGGGGGGGGTYYALTVNINPAGGGTVKPSSGTYASGMMANLTATANTGYKFDHWSGDASGTTSTTSVTMNSAKNVIANFNPVTTPTPATSPAPAAQPNASGKDAAQAAIDSATAAIANATTAGRDVTNAKTLLNQAKASFDAGDWATAQNFAEQATVLANQAPAGPTGLFGALPHLPAVSGEMLMVGMMAVVLVGMGAFFFRMWRAS